MSLALHYWIGRCTSLLRPPPRLRNDLYCVELNSSIPYRTIPSIDTYIAKQLGAPKSSLLTNLLCLTTESCYIKLVAIGKFYCILFKIDKIAPTLIMATSLLNIIKNSHTNSVQDRCKRRKCEHVIELHQMLQMSSTSLRVLSQFTSFYNCGQILLCRKFPTFLQCNF